MRFTITSDIWESRLKFNSSNILWIFKNGMLSGAYDNCHPLVNAYDNILTYRYIHFTENSNHLAGLILFSSLVLL